MSTYVASWKAICLDNIDYLHNCPALNATGFNTLRPRRNGRHFADDIFKCIFLNENVWIPIKISLKFVPKDQINKILALVQIIAWRHQAASHYLDQWWLVYWRIYASLGLNELTRHYEYHKSYKKCAWVCCALFVAFTLSVSSGCVWSWRRHQMEAFSALLALVRRIHQSPVDSPHKGQWLRAFMFSLIWAWAKGWVIWDAIALIMTSMQWHTYQFSSGLLHSHGAMTGLLRYQWNNPKWYG